MLSNFGGKKFDNGARLGNAALDLLAASGLHALRGALPQRCLLCTAASADAMLCADCQRAMPSMPPGCPRCGIASPAGAACAACVVAAPPFSRTVAAWHYVFPADRLLQSFKYGAALALADTFASALGDVLVAHGPPAVDIVVAVPLSRARQRARGFNHAQEIARRLARRMGLPLRNPLQRIRDTPPQAGLARDARLRNVRGAYECTTPLPGLRIALVDDVMTTGATLGAAAAATLDAGAARVEAWVVARTPASAAPGPRRWPGLP